MIDDLPRLFGTYSSLTSFWAIALYTIRPDGFALSAEPFGERESVTSKTSRG